MIEYLGSARELCWFAMEMAEQLEIHKNEKSSLREVDYDSVKKFVIKEIRTRLDEIEKLDGDTRIELEECNKQFTHISNYSLFGFLRGKYNV